MLFSRGEIPHSLLQAQSRGPGGGASRLPLLSATREGTGHSLCSIPGGLDGHLAVATVPGRCLLGPSPTAAPAKAGSPHLLPS